MDGLDPVNRERFIFIHVGEWPQYINQDFVSIKKKFLNHSRAQFTNQVILSLLKTVEKQAEPTTFLQRKLLWFIKFLQRKKQL